MDPAFISPFIESVQNVFSTMLQLPVVVGEPRLKTDPKASYDITGIIGLSGDVSGAVALSFPRTTAERIVAIFCGMEISADHADFPDAVGELVNMISGGAKANFPNRNVSISCPSVIIGEGHRVMNQSETPAAILPFETDCGVMAVEIAVRDNAKKVAA
ncbi:MAG: chemotaxis protein CheX [Planctomycetota bacterium]